LFSKQLLVTFTVMDLFGSIFNNAITKRVNEQVAVKEATAFANGISMINIGLNNALPTINPDAGDYYQVFKTIGAVYEVTDIITKKVLKCPFVFYRVKDKAKLQRSKTMQKTDPVGAYILKAQAIEEVDVPDLQKMLTTGQINPYQTGSQFLWCVILSYLLEGNTYIHPITGGGKPREMYCLPNMTIAIDSLNLLDPIVGYILQSAMLTDKAVIERFPKEEIYHIKTGTPAPIDRRMEYLYGVSPLRAYLEPIRSIREGKEQASKQARNGGVFGVLSPRDKEDQLTKDQKDQLKEKMVEARRSNDPLSRVFPSSIGLMWQQIGLPIGDLKLLELVNASESDIYRAYHWPLQFHDQQSSTFNNQANAIVQGIYDAVAPVCDTLGETFSIMLGKAFGFDVMELDYTQLPEMAVNMKEVAEYLKSLPNGVLTYNEMRAALKYGEKDLPYMNEHYVADNLTTLQRVFDGTSTPPPTASGD
jgi:HK97 family phage portal protein